MKLLMISGDRTLASGKASAFSSMLKEFHTHFDRIDILCPRMRDTGPEIRRVLQNVHIHPSGGSLAAEPGFIRTKGATLFAEHRHDVMTVHDYPPFYNGFGARLLKKQIGIPAVVELHHIVGWPAAASLQEHIAFGMSRMLLRSHIRYFDAVRVVNAAVKDLLVSWGVPSDKIFIVPSVYLDHALVREVEATPKAYDLVFCGRLALNKGLQETIDAVALLPGTTLLIIGDGPLRQSAERRVRAKGLDGRVTFAGWLPSAKDVLAGIASGRVFVMNSRSEGNPRVAVEALALGVPVLATSVGILPNVLREGVNGFFTNGKSNDIAAKAKRLLADPAMLASARLVASATLNRFEKKAAIAAYAEFLKAFIRT